MFLDGRGPKMNFIFILWACAVGIGLGLFASREWISVPLWATERKLRKELGEVRAELFKGRSYNVMDYGVGIIDDDTAAIQRAIDAVGGKHSVAHFEIVDPTIAHRSPSDVFFFKNFEDLL